MAKKKCVPSVEMDCDDEPEDIEIDLGAQWLRRPKGGSNGNSSRDGKGSGSPNNKAVPGGERKKPRKAGKGGPQ
jgi:hypothetical protein